MAFVVQTDFAAIEAAIVSWFETYSGLGSGKVMWADQETPRLDKPYATLSILSDGIELGQDEVRELYQGAFTFAASAVDPALDQFNIPGHGWPLNRKVRATTDGVIFGGAVVGQTYYVKPVDTDNLQLAASAGGAAIDITDIGSGNHTLAGFVERTTVGLRQMVIQAEVYTDRATAPGTTKAMDIMRKVLASVYVQAVIDTFRAEGLTLLRQEGPNNLNEQLEDRWEERTQADFFFLYNLAATDDEGEYIETAKTPTEADGTATYNT